MGYKRKETDNMENLLTNGKKKFVKYDEGAAMFSMGIHSFMDLDIFDNRIEITSPGGMVEGLPICHRAGVYLSGLG